MPTLFEFARQRERLECYRWTFLRRLKSRYPLVLIPLIAASGLSSCRLGYEQLDSDSNASLGGQGGDGDGDGDTPSGDGDGDGDTPSGDGDGDTPSGDGDGDGDTPLATGGTASGGAASGGMGGESPLLGTGGAPVIPDDWWDESFRTRVRVDVDASGLSGALADFPVALRLVGGAYEASKAGSTGDSLRFVADDHASELPFEIERGASLGESIVWIRVTTTAEPFWLYYDNPNAASGEQRSDVWSNGFVAVLHLGDSTADSTSFGHVGVDNGSTPATGRAVGGRVFQLPSTSLNLGTAASLNNLFSGGATLSLWLNPASYGSSLYPRLFDKSQDTLAGGGFGLQLNNQDTGGRIHFEHDFSTTFGQWQTDCCQVVVPGWQHVALSYDSTNLTSAPSIYLDGNALTVNELSTPAGTPPDDTALPFTIGERAGAADRPFDGALDEIRISDVIRSADWTALEYRCVASSCASLSTFSTALD